ncbi:MAG TPA: class I SAM-dependent methyltransferase [Candidatus Obscuribacterales bacterium]
MLTLLKPEIEEYARKKSDSHPALLEDLTRETHSQMAIPEMLCGPLEGQFLKMMVMTSGAKNVLEIGMFTGYSALSMAEGLPEDGKLITLEIDQKAIDMAKKYFAESPHGKKIEIRKGPALETLKELSGPFDFVFIDADKQNYSNYYRAVMPKLKNGGIIMVDNVLYSGEVVRPGSDNARAIDDFNNLVSSDKRVDKVLLTIRDGVFFIRKKA